jgi:predicted secreted protein
MAKRKAAASALALTASFALAMPAQAQTEPAKTEQSAAEQDRLTNLALLAALLKRRAEVAGSADPAQSKEALEFLDSRIAEVKARLGK